MTKKKLLRLVALILIALFTLSACERAATTAGDITETTDDISSIFTMGATLTAQALDPGPVASEEPDNSLDPFAATTTATPPPVVTSTSTPSPTSAPIDQVTIPTSYTLKKREYPYCIARRFDVDIDALMSASGISLASVYGEGLALTIPQNADPFGGERMLLPHPAQYTSLAGDTLYWIACKFGDVYPESIAQANGIDIDEALTVGQVLQIP